MTSAGDAGRSVGNRRVSAGGFAVAAVLAPAMALLICMVGLAIVSGLASPSIGYLGGMISGFLFLLVMVTVWGVAPSLIFGGLVLAVIQMIPRRTRPSWRTFAVGGAAAAALYVLVGIGAHQISPGVAMMFAPWASMTTNPGDGAWWVWISVASSGLAAGLIYARFAKRG